MFNERHPEWLPFAQHVEGMIASAVRELENVTLDIDQTNFTRGKIAALRSILAEGRTPTPPLAQERQPAPY